MQAPPVSALSLRRGTDLLTRVLRRLSRDLKYPASARHIETTLLLSEDGNPDVPEELLVLTLEAVRKASGEDLADIVARMPPSSPIPYPRIWPGEHYRLLAGLVQVVQPRTVVEIGTGDGLSALTMLKFLPTDAELVTVDTVDWRRSARTCLRESDFTSGRLRQELGDLTVPAFFARLEPILRRTDLLFIDGPKDAVFEPALLARLNELSFANAPLVVFDDIRLWNMLATWRAIEQPKIDLTSFGHWSGTGVVRWTPPSSRTSQGN